MTRTDGFGRWQPETVHPYAASAPAAYLSRDSAITPELNGSFPAGNYRLAKLLAEEQIKEAILNLEAAVRPVLSMRAAGVTTGWMM